MAEIAIGVAGCGGRMGRMLIAEIHGTEGCRVAGGFDVKGSAAIGRDLGELAGLGPLGIAAGDDPARLFAAADVMVDFPTPLATVAHAGEAARQKKPLVIGTTGLEPAHEAAIAAAAKLVAIVRSPNMSLGVNLLLGLVRQAAERLDDEYDIEVLEMHHRHKVDAPSGTALALGREVAAARGIDLAAMSQRARDGITGARRRGVIGFAALRGGDVVGDHTVIFAAEGERIEITHRATSRRIFGRRGSRPGFTG
jgi:4-hydroxy-tetrahydrodipicolinate reductase